MNDLWLFCMKSKPYLDEISVTRHYQKKKPFLPLYFVSFIYLFIYLFLRQIPRGKYLDSPHASYGPDRDVDWFTGIEWVM